MVVTRERDLAPPRFVRSSSERRFHQMSFLKLRQKPRERRRPGRAVPALAAVHERPETLQQRRAVQRNQRAHLLVPRRLLRRRRVVARSSVVARTRTAIEEASKGGGLGQLFSELGGKQEFSLLEVARAEAEVRRFRDEQLARLANLEREGGVPGGGAGEPGEPDRSKTDDVPEPSTNALPGVPIARADQ